jgi:hypothetical protein
MTNAHRSPVTGRFVSGRIRRSADAVPYATILAGGGSRNSIARVDTHIHPEWLTRNDSVESTDDDADCDRDSETGADEDADTYTYPDVYGTVETLKRLRPMDPNADRDSRPDVDTITDYRPVSGDACGWGLPAVLLHRVGD